MYCFEINCNKNSLRSFFISVYVFSETCIIIKLRPQFGKSGNYNQVTAVIF